MKVTFYFKSSWLATLQFKKSRKKKRKHLRGSGEIAKKKKDWKKMETNEETVGNYARTKNREATFTDQI